MAVISHANHWNGATGTRTRAGTEYTAVHKLVSNNALDQAQVILDYMVANVVDIGHAYEYAGDSDSNSFCTSIGPPQRDPGSDNDQNIWLCPVQYKPPTDEEEEGTDDNGQPTSDPRLFHPELEIGTQLFSRPVEDAIYRGGYDALGIAGNSHNDMLALGKAPAMNSAFTVYDPPLEREYEIYLYRVSLYRDHPPLLPSFGNVVNSKRFTLFVPFWGFNERIEKYQAKMAPLSGAYRLVNGFKVFQLRLEIAVDFKFGWRVDVPDRGIYPRAHPGDPNHAKGGTFSNTGITKAPESGKQGLNDNDDRQITQPVLFNGAGQPKKVNQATVYGTFSKYPEVPFGPLLNAVGL